MSRILVVDDDQNILKVIRMRLENAGHDVATADNANQAIEIARSEVLELGLIDLKLKGKDGIELMEELIRINPEMPAIILTAHGTIQSAVEAMKKGAYGYLTKPFDNQELLLQIKNCIEKSNLSREVRNLKKMLKETYGFDHIVGKSEKMKKVMEQVLHAAEVDSNVLISGESGTGKELIAKTLHHASPRAGGPFVAINCAAIPETLLESELFGYEKGAFTGADRNKTGFLARANGGSFFLDEISEMPLTLQAKLLRMLDGREYHPLGSTKSVMVDTRIIVASNKNLEDQVAQGRFRKDLFYRIHVIVVHLPPLRERTEDIPLLARHFLEKYSEAMKKDIKGVTPQAMKKLLFHRWPGNVRELENTIESAVAMAINDVIGDDLILRSAEVEDGAVKFLKDAKDDFERNYLAQLIELTRGNVTQAAKLAGKYRADLYDLLKKHRLNPEDFRKGGQNLL